MIEQIACAVFGKFSDDMSLAHIAAEIISVEDHAVLPKVKPGFAARDAVL